jgi:hypothetical protein
MTGLLFLVILINSKPEIIKAYPDNPFGMYQCLNDESNMWGIVQVPLACTRERSI